MQFDLHATLIEIVRAPSPSTVAATLTTRVGKSKSVVLVRVWLASGAGLLSLASSAGTPSGGGSYARLDGEFREMAIADAKIHEIAASKRPMVVRGLRGDEEWLTNSAWAARQGVRAFIALPLVVDEEGVGLVVIFDREMPNDDLLWRLRLVADVAAARLTSVSANDLRSPWQGRRSPGATEVVTRDELRRIEKQNIEAALAQAQGKVFGANGAAALLGMRPTTLASRLKALGIR